MYTLTYWDDLETWRRIAQACLKVGGNRILGSRFHALQMMIDWRRKLPHMNEEKQHPMMEALSRVCEFAKQREVSAAEKVVFLYIFLSICEAELENKPMGHTYSRSVWEQAWSDGKDFDEPYPTEDDPNNLVPPSDIDQIPW